MAERCVVSVSTRPEIRDRLDRLAAVTRRSKSFLANEAIERYLAAEEEFVARVEARIAEADDGDFIGTDDLRRRFADNMKTRFGTGGS